MKKRFPAVNEVTGGQSWEDLPDGSALVGLLLPTKTGKDGGTYRLLKIVSRPATPEEFARLGNDRVPVVVDPFNLPRE